jgi:hypothetical protein
MSSGSNLVDYYYPVIATATDYYPFGMEMPYRNTVDTNTHRTNITAIEILPVHHAVTKPYTDLPARMTPFGGATVASSPPGQRITASPGNGVKYSVPFVTPGYSQSVIINIAAAAGSVIYSAVVKQGTTVIGSLSTINLIAGANTINYTPGAGSVDIEIINSGFVTGVSNKITSIISDSITFVNELVVASITSDDDYHYGFNGQMKTNEWAGKGNHNTALFWEYDTRTGRRLNKDPKTNTWESPYATFGGNPIWRSDVLGDKFKNGNTEKKDEAEKKKNEAQKKLEEAQKNLEAQKNDPNITKAQINDLERAVKSATTNLNNMKAEYAKQVLYEAMTNDVIKSFNEKNPNEFNKWDQFMQNGKEIDIPITIQTEDIDMVDEQGIKIGTTKEGTAFSVYEKDGKRYVASIKSTLVAPHFVTGKAAIISVTSDMVHGLGHVEVYIKSGNMTETESEPGALNYESKQYNNGKGPKK